MKVDSKIRAIPIRGRVEAELAAPYSNIACGREERAP